MCGFASLQVVRWLQIIAKFKASTILSSNIERTGSNRMPTGRDEEGRKIERKTLDVGGHTLPLSFHRWCNYTLTFFSAWFPDNMRKVSHSHCANIHDQIETHRLFNRLSVHTVFKLSLLRTRLSLAARRFRRGSRLESVLSSFTSSFLLDLLGGLFCWSTKVKRVSRVGQGRVVT